MTPEEVVIVPYRDGPYLVRGPLTLRDQDGRRIDVGRRTVALCRCGKSRIRPFCDGTHRTVRFTAPSEPEAARPQRGPDPQPRAAKPAADRAVSAELASLAERLGQMLEGPASGIGAQEISDLITLLAAVSEQLGAGVDER